MLDIRFVLYADDMKMYANVNNEGDCVNFGEAIAVTKLY